jgi:sugar phosphate isomerase/epimerase
MSRVSATTFPLVDRPLADALKVIVDAGLTKVDLLERMPHISLDPNECRLEDVRATADAQGVEIANLATYVGAAFASEDKADQEREWDKVRRAIDAAQILGARSMRGFRSPQYDSAESIPRIAPWIRRCAEYAAERNVYMGMENHGGELSGSPEACRDLARQVDSPYFGILYDPCNLWTRGTDYRAGLETMKDHIVHVHIKDGTSEAASQKHTMLGDGDIDIPWVLKRLDEIGYDGHITLEYEVETEPPETGLKTWCRFLAGIT